MPTYMDLALADVNGDRREDLIFANGDVYLCKENGTLPEGPSFHLNPPTGEMKGWTFLAAADFDGDGWTDLALLSHNRGGTTVWLYRTLGIPSNHFPKSQRRSSSFRTWNSIVTASPSRTGTVTAFRIFFCASGASNRGSVS